MNKLTLVAVAVSALIGATLTHFYYQSEINEYKLQKEQEYAHALEQKIEENKRLQQSVYDVEETYLKKLQDYEKTIADMRNGYTLSGVFDCSRNGECVPRTDGSTSEFVCYRTRELQGKIEKSLVIAHEADELAIRYNALLGLTKKD